MIKIVRKPTAKSYQDPNDLGLHPNTIILCNGFGVNLITKDLYVRFVQVHDQENPSAIIAHLPELRFNNNIIEQEVSSDGKIITLGYPDKQTIKNYLKFDFINSGVNITEDSDLSVKACIWLLLNDKWRHLELWKEWAVEYNGELIEVPNIFL